MSRREEYEAKTERLLQPIAEANGVSSPGLGRTLKKDKHLRASVGQDVEIRLFKPVDKRRDFSGVLEGFDTEQVTIRNGDTSMTLKRADIAVIRLAIDL